MAKVFRIDRRSPNTWQAALGDFLAWKQAQQAAPRTLLDYRKHITQFFARYPDAYDPGTVRQRVLAYMAEDVAAGTFNLRRQYLASFFNWCVREGIFPENPLADVPKRKDPGKVRHLPEDVLRELLRLPDKSTFAGLRDYTLILLTLATGIRPGEALSLLPGDVDLRGLAVTVRRTVAKTRVERVLPIPPLVADAIRDLIAARHPAWGEKVPLFCSFSGRRLTVEEWGKRLQKYGARIGAKVTPYSLRHSFAVQTLRAGANAFTVQHMLGHTSMAMTKRYVNLMESDLREQMAQANPLTRLLPQGQRQRKVSEDRPQRRK